MPPLPPPSPNEGLSPPPGLAALFLGFLSVAVIAFGGVLPIVRRAVVERLRWITPDEFTELVSFAQFLPGPNIINFSIVLGRRFHGPAGAAAACLGLTLVPAIGVVIAGAVFNHYADIAAVSDMLAGLAAAAAGLVIAMAARMAEPLWRHPSLRRTGIAVAAFVAIAIFGLSLPIVMLVLAPISMGLAWWALR